MGKEKDKKSLKIEKEIQKTVQKELRRELSKAIGEVVREATSVAEAPEEKLKVKKLKESKEKDKKGKKKELVFVTETTDKKESKKGKKDKKTEAMPVKAKGGKKRPRQELTAEESEKIRLISMGFSTIEAEKIMAQKAGILPEVEEEPVALAATVDGEEAAPEEEAAEPIPEVLLKTTGDRRLLPNVPSPTGERSNQDRRRESEYSRRVINNSLPEHRGVRYLVNFMVRVQCKLADGKEEFDARAHDISTTGMLLEVENEEHRTWMAEAESITLRFRIEPGNMPEGYEMNARLGATMIHTRNGADGSILCGMQFDQTLVNYAYRRKGVSMRLFAAVSLGIMVLAIILLRATSIRFIRFNTFTYVYGVVTAAYLLSRYAFGALYKPTPINPEFKPAVSIIVPCFNEEEWIQRTILGCLNQDYPTDSLEVIIVDDHSTDNSPQKIQELIDHLSVHEKQLNVAERVKFVRQDRNLGKRDAMARGTGMAKHDLVVFVDSDSFLDPYAIVNIVQPFQDPLMGGVSGRTDVANSFTNFVTKMQSVRYYISFRIIKAAEGYFDAVGCLSGPLSCYRKDLLNKYMDAWLNQSFLGRKATFGDDRSMTNFILRHNRASYQDTAICSTIVPNTHRMFLKQQMRWKRSWLRESSIAASFMWRKEPMMAVSFYLGFIIPIIAPVIVLYNLFYIPIVNHSFPTTFLFGLFAMSMLMSMTQLLLRRSRLWPYGIYYHIYHIAILMWQMPIAWVTFYKSTWGTRMTESDVAAQNRREGKSPDATGKSLA